MARKRFSAASSTCVAMVSLNFAAAAPIQAASAAHITITRVNTLDEMWGRLFQCWQPPVLPMGHPGMQITAMVTFARNGEIFGRPKITFETPGATDTDSIIYRTAVMEALQRCAPMPFTDSM